MSHGGRKIAEDIVHFSSSEEDREDEVSKKVGEKESLEEVYRSMEENGSNTPFNFAAAVTEGQGKEFSLTEKQKNNVVEYLKEERQKVLQISFFTYERRKKDCDGNRIRKRSVIELLMEQQELRETREMN